MGYRSDSLHIYDSLTPGPNGEQMIRIDSRTTGAGLFIPKGEWREIVRDWYREFLDRESWPEENR